MTRYHVNLRSRSCHTGMKTQNLGSPVIVLWISLFCPAKAANGYMKCVSGGGSVAWVCKLSQQQGLILRHGVTIAPTMQRHQQPVSQDLLAWIFWEFQHVDTVEKGKKTQSAVAVMTTHGAGRVGMTPRCPQEKELLRYEVPVAHSSRKRTLPVFKLPSAYKDSPTQSQRY